MTLMRVLKVGGMNTKQSLILKILMDLQPRSTVLDRRSEMMLNEIINH